MCFYSKLRSKWISKVIFLRMEQMLTILHDSCPGNMSKYYPDLRDILPDRRQDHINIIIILTVYSRTVFKNGSCCTVRRGEKKRFLTPFFERKHTIHRCLNGDIHFQCSNRALLCDQKYKWHTFQKLTRRIIINVIICRSNQIYACLINIHTVHLYILFRSIVCYFIYVYLSLSNWLQKFVYHYRNSFAYYLDN
jgi:hypothetical protein